MAKILLLSALLLSFQAQAAFRCKFVHHEQTDAVKAIVVEDAYKQWLLWEQTANFAPFVKSTEPFTAPVVSIGKEEFQIQKSQYLSAENVDRAFIGIISVNWVKHPYNTVNTVPFFDRAATAKAEFVFTASRSMAFTHPGLRGFTIKLPTDRPHGPRGELQSAKANTKNDVLTGILRSDHILKVDKEFGVDPEIIVLPEYMTIAETNSMNGMLIRDVRQTDDGHYYLPALSIPYMGRKIAEINGEEFNSFWQKHYAEALGRAKAKLLLRYGLQMETPNSQNMLIQLNRDLKPTGVIVFRDVSDSFFVKDVSTALGFYREVYRDEYDLHEKIQPFYSNSLWRFNEAGKDSVSNAVINQWGLAHNKSYVTEITKETGLQYDSIVQLQDSMPDFYNLLKSPAGQAGLRSYRQKQDQLRLRRQIEEQNRQAEVQQAG